MQLVDSCPRREDVAAAALALAVQDLHGHQRGALRDAAGQPQRGAGRVRAVP
jgi:hypothetical protein